MSKQAYHGYLYGIVQGVGMRFTVIQVANELGIQGGYVRNLPDGRVEIYAEGDPERIQELIHILETNQVGRGKVDKVEGQWMEPKENLSEFKVRR